jgi:membrane-associated protease RseP (regulator of RpoE activity)
VRPRPVVITDYLIAFSLVVYAGFAPHSIAFTQGAFLFGLLCWAIQIAMTRRFLQSRSPVDIAVLGFFACCVISSFLSYDALISIKGLRSPAFFLAFYLVSRNIKTLRFALLLAFLMIGSCLLNVAYSAGKLAIGRGVHIDSINADSPFAKEGLRIGDVILEVDGRPVKNAQDISDRVDSQRGRVRVKYQRGETVSDTTVSRRVIKRSPETGINRLGLDTSPGRNFRISGFYSHYETYAEVLQLIAALAVGLFIAQPNKRSWVAIFLASAIVLITGTLILTSTRAPIAGLILAVAVMAIASYERRTVLLAMFAIFILAPVALFAVQQTRGISIFDLKEGSAAYRLEVWREAFVLIKNHPLVGIGKGTEQKKEVKERFGLFDNDRLPPGHFHSTPIQVATWWGLPALAFYASFMTIFVLQFWRLSRRLKSDKRWEGWGLALGGVGVLTAFNVSSLAHFNFGDGEVVMVLWLVTGIVFAVRRLAVERPAESKPGPEPEPPSPESSEKNRLRPQEVASESSSLAAKVR